MKNKKEQRQEILHHGFGPVYDENSEILILGSFPSVKSREISFYYGHPQNRFWKVIAAVCEARSMRKERPAGTDSSEESSPEKHGGFSVPAAPEEKKAFLLNHHIALYDVIESCTITGSSDSTIRNVVVTDLDPILRTSKIGTRIFANGTKAFELYQKYTYPKTGIPAVKLPSTSPANAAWSIERLISVWTESIGSAK